VLDKLVLEVGGDAGALLEHTVHAALLELYETADGSDLREATLAHPTLHAVCELHIAYTRYCYGLEALPDAVLGAFEVQVS